jgi:hypothetical protein
MEVCSVDSKVICILITQHLKYVNPNSTGYFVVDLTPTSACADYWQTDLSGLLSPSLALLGTWCTKVNENHLKLYTGPTYTAKTYPALVPYAPRNNGLTVGMSKLNKIR